MVMMVVSKLVAMFTGELRKSEKSMEDTSATLVKARQAAKEAGLDMEGETQVEQHLASISEDEYRQIRDNKWLRKMYRWDLVVPSKSIRSGMWEHSSYTYEWLLTEEGFNQIRAKVREEQKQRREPLILAIGLTAGVTGLMGAATGLAAVLFK